MGQRTGMIKAGRRSRLEGEPVKYSSWPPVCSAASVISKHLALGLQCTEHLNMRMCALIKCTHRAHSWLCYSNSIPASKTEIKADAISMNAYVLVSQSHSLPLFCAVTRIKEDKQMEMILTMVLLINDSNKVI